MQLECGHNGYTGWLLDRALVCRVDNAFAVMVRGRLPLFFNQFG